MEDLPQGRYFSIEKRTPVENKLHILMSGMMVVRCDGLFLHAIRPNEFIDSVEWKAKEHGQGFPTYQVSIEAVTDCKMLIVDQDDLGKSFDETPSLHFVLDSVVSKDVSQKLYAVSDVTIMCASAQENAQNAGNVGNGLLPGVNANGGKSLRVLDFHRTVSMDAIHTGGKGHVRSHQWLKSAAGRPITGKIYFEFIGINCIKLIFIHR